MFLLVFKNTPLNKIIILSMLFPSTHEYIFIEYKKIIYY